MRLLLVAHLTLVLALAACSPAAAAGNGQIAAIAFNNQLVTINPDGSGYAVRYSGAANEQLREPAWSPDGNRIAFTDIDSVHGARIFVYDVLTATARPVTEHPLLDPLHYVISDDLPSWSPDGSRVAFRRRPDAAGGYTVRADGSDLQPLPVPSSQMGVWSPDGSRFSFTSFDAEVGVVGADGMNAQMLLPYYGAGFGTWPQWSPDSRELVFTRYESPGHHLMRVPASGGTPVNVTVQGTYDQDDPDWSPDGTEIVYSRSPGFTVRAVRPDGSGDRVIFAGALGYPDWQPCVAGVTVSCVSITPATRSTRPTCPAQLTVTTQRDTPAHAVTCCVLSQSLPSLRSMRVSAPRRVGVACVYIFVPVVIVPRNRRLPYSDRPPAVH